MPHECTTCGRTFPDGSKEMLSGCPDCGGNKFQFHPSGTDRSVETGVPDTDILDGETPDRSPGTSDQGSVDPTEAGRSDDGFDEAGTGPDPSVEFDSSPDSPLEPDEPEDSAQASARSTVVAEDELPRSDADSPEEASATPDDDPDPDDSDRPELSELRAELNEQFESIKIHDRGEYELNLMELYDREEHIVALQEDGRYVIDVPGSWRDEETE